MSRPRAAVYQGTFDPFTQGHLSVLKSALSLFDEVVVLLLVNPAKKPLFSVAERREMISASVQGLKGVRVDADEGLLVDYMQKHGLQVCVRGVRNGQDAAYELQNHRLSQNLYPALQTLLLPCEPAFHALSSSAVKTACAGGSLSMNWVPAAVAEKLKEKYPGLVLI